LSEFELLFSLLIQFFSATGYVGLACKKLKVRRQKKDDGVNGRFNFVMRNEW